MEKKIKILNSNLKFNSPIVEGRGPFLLSRNGTKLFDCWLGSGTLIYGHESIGNFQFQSNWLLPEGGIVSDRLMHLIEKTVDFSIGSLGFQTSGSSAIHRACRIARAVSGKENIAIIGRFWHGSDDGFLFEGSKRKKLSDGIPDSSQEKSIFFETLDDFFDSNRILDFAGILVEPFQGADPSKPMLKGITKERREMLKKNDILLIVDEVITGFRTGYGSCNSSREVQPDLVVFGKAMAGGFPIGVVLVSDEWSTRLETKSIFWGGTFSASPFQLKMAEYTLNRLIELNYDILEKNLSDIIQLLNFILKDTSIKIFSGGGFGRVGSNLEKSTDVSSRGFLEQDKNSMKKAKDIIFQNNIFINNNLLIFPSIFNINEKERI